MFAYHFVRYRFAGILLGVALMGDTFQQKIDEIFKGIADDILIVGYDADCRDHNKALR